MNRDFVKIITLCGSWELRDDIQGYIKREFEKCPNSVIVLTPAYPPERPKTVAHKKKLINEHFHRIDLADEVVFVLRDRIGVNTAIELGYAIAHGKKLKLRILSDKDALSIAEELAYFLEEEDTSIVMH